MMKKVLTIVAAGVLTLGLVGAAAAQNAGAKGGKATGGAQGGRVRGGMRMGQDIMAKLNLTPDQKKKVDALQKKTGDEMKKVMGDGKGDRRQMRDKVRPIMESYRKSLMDILTPEQEAKFKKLMEEARAKFRQGGAGRPGGAQGGAKAGGAKTKTPPPSN